VQDLLGQAKTGPDSTMDFFIEGQTSYDFRPGANGEYLKFEKAWGKGEKVGPVKGRIGVRLLAVRLLLRH
jgi:hypothetical protein